MKSMKRMKKNLSDKVKPRKDRVSDLEDLVHEELSGAEPGKSSLTVTSTDDDEDEGLGDGNIGRSKNSILGRE